MDNSRLCKNCGSEAPLSAYICGSCKAVLRDRIPDLNTWNLIKGLFWNPSATLEYILCSERKNLLPVVLFLAAFKLYTIALIVSGQMGSGRPVRLLTLILSTLILSVLLAGVSFISLKINYKNPLKEKSRLNHFSLYAYSLLPVGLSLPLLQMLEYSFFGEYIFVPVPSPLHINPVLTYLFIFFESLPVIYSAYLMVRSSQVLTMNSRTAVIFSLLFLPLAFALQMYLIIIIG